MSISDESTSRSQPQTDSAQGAGKQDYQAFCINTGEQRYLEIRLRFPESAECPSYAMLRNINADFRMGVGLSLEFGDAGHLTMLVIIKGDNLLELYRALKDWRVEWIAEFSPSEHDEPKDKTAPFIRSITVHTKRPEEIPPHIKRH